MNANCITAKNRKQALRLSNFELLRIISMFLIVAHHYSVHGGFRFDTSVSANKIFVGFLFLGGKLGVNCFVLITGYFSSGKTFQVKWKSVFKFLITVTVYSVMIYGVAFLSGREELTVFNVIKCLLPLNYNAWWFATTYFVLLLLSPFLNITIENMKQKQHAGLIGILFVLWSVFSTLNLGTFKCNDLTWFVFLYIVAAYIKKYPHKMFNSKKITAAVTILSFALIMLSIVGLNWFHFAFPNAVENLADYFDFSFLKRPERFADMTAVPLTILSISLFCLFKNLQMNHSRIINTVANAMFGVYLIHDSLFFRYYLWRELFKNSQYQNSPMLYLHAIIAIGLVFVVCTVICLIYNATIRKATDFLVEKSALKIAKRKAKRHSDGLQQTGEFPENNN